MTVAPLTVSPTGAAQAYARVANGGGGEARGDEDGGGFGAALGRALQGVTESGRAAEAQSIKAIGGSANLTEVATAVSRAELALQTAVAVRDKVVQAYQDVMRMPI